MASPSNAPDPDLIHQLALAYRSSAIFFAASDLNVFTHLSHGPRTASEVAARVGSAAEPTRLMLESCADAGLLERDGNRFRNTPTANWFLVRGGTAYLGDSLKYARDLYQPWGALTDLVRSGCPTLPPQAILGDDKAMTRAFVMAMHERARGIGSVLPHNVDLTGRRRLLDIGGGPGTYAVGLCRQTPGLTATVLDRPGVLEVTRELVDAAGFSDRVTLLPGDYLETPFGTGYDAALLSGMMHRETQADVTLLLRKTFEALAPGGLVMISDVFFDDDNKNTPPFTTLFALNMMLTSEHGSAHAKTEMERWMRENGLRDISMHEMPRPNPHTLILGMRP